MSGKKKQKKGTEPNEASKLIAARISQLELDAAGEKDQEAEIGAYPPTSIVWSSDWSRIGEQYWETADQGPAGIRVVQAPDRRSESSDGLP